MIWDAIALIMTSLQWLTHWGRVTHIDLCIGKLTIIGSDNGLSPDRRQAIIWTNAGILLIGPLGTKLSEILIAIHIFSFKKMHLKMSSGKWQPSCLGLNVLSPCRDFPKCMWYPLCVYNLNKVSSFRIVINIVLLSTAIYQESRVSHLVVSDRIMISVWRYQY